jgi:hypothetical protein
MLIFFLVVVSYKAKIPPNSPENGLEAVHASIQESNSFNDKSGLLNARTKDVVCQGLLQTSALTQSSSYFQAAYIWFRHSSKFPFSFPGYVD